MARNKAEKKYTWKNYVAYVNDNPKKYWFKRKLYGWGWTPATWQGWWIMVLFVVLAVAWGMTIQHDRDVVRALVQLGVLVLLLIWICYKTGEKPKWSWGR